MTNNHDIVDLTLHGGGQGFESPRLHSENVGFAGKTLRFHYSSLLHASRTPTGYTNPRE